MAKAIIVGGGIGGLTAAIALRRVGVDAAVFEKAGGLREIGAGISLWVNAMRALERLGLADAVRAAGREEIGGTGLRIVLLDSVSLVRPSDAGQIVVTGSHGGLVGGDPAAALRVDAFAAVYNDAGIGVDEAGLGRLPALESRGIAAFTVAAASARIGEARSTLDNGIVSRANPTALRLGARPGEPAREIIARWAAG